ncbi:hypothetical protein MSAN_00532300 [Mycena sanguinolenta]|uniref:Uncharacterized protein n=1 Tax=Mycena sanguinolenta TaxID=230812 RepID=A0A8H6ZCM5_9AGAR|nr:hypothetical protein MSAN_00532300 [Mycena sanguinolenta]
MSRLAETSGNLNLMSTKNPISQVEGRKDCVQRLSAIACQCPTRIASQRTPYPLRLGPDLFLIQQAQAASTDVHVDNVTYCTDFYQEFEPLQRTDLSFSPAIFSLHQSKAIGTLSPPGLHHLDAVRRIAMFTSS